MSLLSLGACSSHRHAVQTTFRVVSQQTRSAAQKTASANKPQTIGGVKKHRTEKLAKMFAAENIHKTFDLPVFTRMPEEKLKTPRRGETPATLPELFQPGVGHSLDLPRFQPDAIVSENVGTVAGFSISPQNPARAFGLPKKMFLEFRIMSQPASVIRDVTVETVQALEKAQGSSSLDSRLVLSGRAGCGKSYLLHQAVQYANAKKWIVFYIPRAASLVNSTTPYIYDLRTQTFLQPYASYQAVEKLLTVNADAFSKLKLTTAIVTEKVTLPVGQTLAEVAALCVKDKSYNSAPTILSAIVQELQTQTEYPVLLAVDDFQALFHKSAYKDPFFNAIKSFQLSLPRLIMEFASGKRSFAKGTFMAAITASDTTYTVPLELRDTLDLGYAHPTSPYTKRSSELLQYTKGLKPLTVPQRLSVKEASSLFQMWKDDMALSSDRYDELFLSKYVESDGNARDFVWKGLLSTFSP